MINNMTVSELIREVQNNANATLMERVLASALDNLGDEMDEKEKDIQDFANLIHQEIGEKTKYIWYPEKERQDLKSQAYKSEP